MILGYLILSHLLGDFILQPDRLVYWKSRSKWGAFVHSGVHLLINLIFFLPLIYYGFFELIWISLGISFIHFWIDEAKIFYGSKHSKTVTPFIIDQLFHFLTILAAYSFIYNRPFNVPDSRFFDVYSNHIIIVFLISIVFLSNVVEVFLYEKKREKNRQITFKIDKQKVAIRLITFTLVYTFTLLVIFS